LTETMNHQAGITLAIETSGRIGSVAVGHGGKLLAQSVFTGFMRQAAELFDHIQKLLQQVLAVPDDIQNVIITVGPGSFTGLRIAVTAAKMLHFARKVNIIAVDSTDVIAQNAPDYAADDPDQPVDCICTILDAKRNLFYTSLFERDENGWSKLFGTEAVTADELIGRLGIRGKSKVYFLGEGLVYYADKFRTPFTVILDEKYWMPTAAGLYHVGHKLAAEGHFADPVTLTPLYIRKPDTIEKQK